jgi:ABC-type multidrug transport system fused ATPase/permease subunit
MIKDHCEKSCRYNLNIVKEGKFRDLTYKPYFCKFIPSRVENFIPRPKDLHEILKLINNKNRFISVIGNSGIGKSTLIRELVRFIHFRNIFKDGVIYLDIRSCEKMLKIFEVFTIELFDNSSDKLNKSCT